MVSLLTGSVVARFYNTGDVGGDVSLMGNNLTGMGNVTLAPLQTTGDEIDDGGLSVETKLGIVMSISMLVGFTQVSTSLYNAFRNVDKAIRHTSL